ncbi:MAG: B12-binding domain-containing radical SAM protein [Syntrophorhabdaceae bacterium]
MKVLLVQPPKPDKALGGEDFHIFEPLALEYLAAGIAEHDVRILDMRLDPDLDSLLRNFRPDAVGLTSYTVHVKKVRMLSEQIKAFDPHIVTIVGGHHATVAPEDFYTPFIDVIVSGAGVFALQEIVGRLEKNMDLEEIPGAFCVKDGATVINSGNRDTDLDMLPLPRRDLTACYRDSYFTEWMKPLASICTSKGCPFRCSFCALWKLTGGHYFTRRPERIVEELRTITEKYVFFADDESLLDAKRMASLADLIRQSGIDKRYFLYARSDTVVKHRDLIEKWKKVGLERVFVGLESMRDADLKLIRKGSTPENNRKAVQILKSLNIDIFPTFIVRPDFDRQDFADLRHYCLELDLNFIGFSVLTPLPGTDLYNEVKDKLITNNYDYFDFFHTVTATTLPLKDFYHELTELYKHSRSLKNRLVLMSRYPLRDLLSLFRAYGNFLKRLNGLGKDYDG